MSSSVLSIREGTDSIHPKAAHRHGRAAWYNQERLRTFIHFELNTFSHTEEQISSCRQVLAVLPADMPEGHPDTPTETWAMRVCFNSLNKQLAVSGIAYEAQTFIPPLKKTLIQEAHAVIHTHPTLK